MKRTFDIVIVGGGVMGTALAYYLGRRAVGSVAVLEKSYLAAGSSGKSGAIVRQHYSNILTASMARYGLKIYERFDEIVGGPPVFTRTGMAMVVKHTDEQGLEENLVMQRQLGIDTHRVSRVELAELDPNVLLQEDEVAAWESEAGYVEAPQVVASYADAARRENVEIVEGIKVQAILRSNDRVVGVETNEGRIESRCVVLTTGPWTAALAKTMGLDLPVSPCRTQVALFRRPPNFGRRVATHVDFVQGIYFKPTHGDMIHIGSVQGEEIDDQVDPDHYNEAASGDWLPLMRQRLTRRYPGMYKGYGRGGFGALYAITPDWHPILDRLPGLQGGYCAVGFSGHGFKMAPTVGQLMAELIVDQKTSTFDIAPLRASRFAEQDLVKIKYAYGVIG